MKLTIEQKNEYTIYNIFFNDLADLAYKHEMASKNKELEFITNDFANLVKELNKVIKISKTYLGK